MNYIVSELVLDEPIPATLANDVIEVNGDTLTIKRGTAIFATRTIVLRRPVTPGVIPSNRTLNSVFFAEVNPMASGTMATLTGVTVAPSGEITFSFSDGISESHPSAASALSSLALIDTTPDLAKQLLMLQSIRKSSGGVNYETVVGRSCTVDCAADNPVSMSIAVGPV